MGAHIDKRCVKYLVDISGGEGAEIVIDTRCEHIQNQFYCASVPTSLVRDIHLLERRTENVREARAREGEGGGVVSSR